MKVKEPLTVCLLYGDPIAAEQDLKEDFANRYFMTNDVLIVVDGEWYDGSYCKHFGSHVPDAIAFKTEKDIIPDTMPEGKRVIIVCAGDDSNSERLNAALLKIMSWDMSWKDVESDNYACCKRKTVVVYGINNIAERLDFAQITDQMNSLYENEISVKLLTDCDFSTIGIKTFQGFLEKSLSYLNVIVSYNACANPEFDEAASKYFPDRKFSMNSTIEPPYDAYAFGNSILKYETDYPYYSEMAFHDHVRKEGLLLIPDKGAMSDDTYQKLQSERYRDFSKESYKILKNNGLL